MDTAGRIALGSRARCSSLAASRCTAPGRLATDPPGHAREDARDSSSQELRCRKAAPRRVARRRARARPWRRRCSPTCWRALRRVPTSSTRSPWSPPTAPPSPPRAASGVHGARGHRAGGPVAGGADRHPARAGARLRAGRCSCPATRRCSSPPTSPACCARSGPGVVRSCRTATATGTNALVLTPAGRDRAELRPRTAAPATSRCAEEAGVPRPDRRGGRAGARRGHARRPRDAVGRARAAPRPGAVHPRRPPPARPRRRGPRASLRLSSFSVTALAPLPAIRPGDDLAGADRGGGARRSRAPATWWWSPTRSCRRPRGALRRLEEIEPGERARELADEHGKDARLVQAVLDESAELLRAARRHAHLRDPPRVRVRERGRGPVERLGGGRRAGAAARGPGRLGAAAARRASRPRAACARRW